MILYCVIEFPSLHWWQVLDEWSIIPNTCCLNSLTYNNLYKHKNVFNKLLIRVGGILCDSRKVFQGNEISWIVKICDFWGINVH